MTFLDLLNALADGFQMVLAAVAKRTPPPDTMPLGRRVAFVAGTPDNPKRVFDDAYTAQTYANGHGLAMYRVEAQGGVAIPNMNVQSEARFRGMTVQ